jgi:hypothetical protein
MPKALDQAVKLGVDVKNNSPFRTSGVPGTPIYGGYVQENETNSELTGTRKYTKFSETLVNVAIVGAGVRYFLNLIAKASWSVEPADDTPEAQKFADFVKDVMEDVETPWRRIARRAAMYRFYGFSLQEWTAVRREDGTIGISDIAPRPQPTIEKWDTDRIGTVLGVVQRAPQDGKEIYLKRSKLVYLVDDSLSDSPEGLGLVRHIFPYAERLKIYEKLEQDGFETDLRGIPIGRAPLAILAELVKDGTISEEQKNEWEGKMTDFMENHIREANTGLLLDSMTYQTQDEKGAASNVKQWDLELLQGKTSALPDLGRAIQRVTRNIAILLGVEQLLLGENSVGSYSLSRDKTNVFFLIVDSTLQELAEAFNTDFVKNLWRLNGYPKEMMPKLAPESIKFRDIEQVTKALSDLSSAGATLDLSDPAVNEVRDLLGLSPIPEELIKEIKDRAQAEVDAKAKAMKESKEEEDPKEEEKEKDDDSGSGDE